MAARTMLSPRHSLNAHDPGAALVALPLAGIVPEQLGPSPDGPSPDG
jgi:hypothetical protein